MTRIINVPVFQGHPVPERPHAPRGPFPAELFAKGGVNYAYEPQSDSGAAEMPTGATAQNGFREVRFFRCRVCQSVLRDVDVDEHAEICKDEE